MKRKKHKNDITMRTRFRLLGVERLDEMPQRVRGWWEGVKEHRVQFNRRDRRVAREEIRAGKQPEPIKPRGCAKWEL